MRRARHRHVGAHTERRASVSARPEALQHVPQLGAVRPYVDRFVAILRITGFVILLSLAGTFVSDYVWIEYRLGHLAGPDALGTVTYYYATPLKNGRLEIFYNQPQTEVCVYALFPHAGYRPCWFAVREKVRSVG